jgi:hypothetical protein
MHGIAQERKSAQLSLDFDARSAAGVSSGSTSTDEASETVLYT